MKILTIKQKMSGTGSIHDLASDWHDREIKFPEGSKFAVVKASFYGGKGYTTHRTEGAAIEGLDPIEGLKPSQYTNHVFLGEVVEKINEIIQKMNRLIELKNGELHQIGPHTKMNLSKVRMELAIKCNTTGGEG